MKAGLLAEFETADAMLAAARGLRALGVTRMDTYSPYPVHGTDEVLGLRKSPVSKTVLVMGLVGALLGYGIQWLTNTVDYPLNVGGRPIHAAPSYVLITFETTVLLGGITALLSVFIYSRLPRLWDPVFEVDGFERASIDRFFVAVDETDGVFNAARLRSELLRLGALRISPFGPHARGEPSYPAAPEAGPGADAGRRP